MPGLRPRPAGFGATPETASSPHARPLQDRSDRLLVATLVAASLVAQWLWMDAGVGPYDEGLMLFGADRVLRGDVPYRDFWTLYGPAGFYVDALLFRVFGEFALVGRGFDAAVKAAIVGLAFAIVRRFGRAGLATAAALLVLGLLIYLRSYGVPVFPAVAASLVAVLALDAVATRASRRAAALAGVAVGSALLFRHDLGAYAAVGSLVFIAFGALPARSAETAAGDRRALFVRFAGGLLVVVAPVAVWLLAVVPLHDLAFSLVEVPLRVYPKVRALPFPSLADAAAEFGTQRSLGSLGPLVVYLPVVAVAIGVASEVSRLRDPAATAAAPAPSWVFQLLLLLDVLFFVKGLVRVSPVQMGASLVLSTLVVAAAAARARGAGWRGLLLGIGALAAAGLVAKPFVNAAERTARAGGALLSDRWISQAGSLCRDTGVPRLRCLRLDADRMTVARYLLDHGSRGQRVYFGVGRHDRILVGDVALYFASEAVAPTRWHDLHPGVQTTRQIQTEMIAELDTKPVAFAVINTEWDDQQEPNDSARSSGIRLLDDYLQRRFRPVLKAGTFTVLAPLQRATMQ